MLEDDEKKLLRLGVYTLESIRAQLTDLQAQFSTLFYMTEKYQKEVVALLRQIRR